MSLRAWYLAFRDAFRSMTQSSLMSLASMATVAASLLVLGAVLLTAVNLEHWAKNIEQQVEIKAYLCTVTALIDEPGDPARCNDQPLTDAQHRAITEQIRQIPGVVEATFVDRDTALVKMREQYGPQVVEGLDGENPLRDSIEVKVEDANEIKAIAEQILTIRGVSDAQFGQEYVEPLLAVTNAVRIGGVSMVLLLLVATVLTLSNTIRLAVYARRREISIMKLVGATDWYIRRPFMLEGIFLGGFGAVAAAGLVGTAYVRVAESMAARIPFLPIIPPQQVLMNLALGLLLLGAALGAAGSLISLRKFLKV